MPDALMEQEELDDICPFMVEELELYIGESDTFSNDEATIYALCQLLHNRLEKLDMTLHNKGAVVSTLIRGLIEHDSGPLAAYNEMIRCLIEKKSSTIQ